MLAKVFEGKPKAIESNLSAWMEESRPVVKHITSAAFKSGVIYVTVLYDEPRQRPERVRGSEKPGQGPTCICGEAMIRRERKADGEPFWGCGTFPTCRHVVNFDDADHAADGQSKDEEEFAGQSGYNGPGGFGPNDDDIPF